jgi:tRNA-splicing endonuclease subunit Sen15, fungi type
MARPAHLKPASLPFSPLQSLILDTSDTTTLHSLATQILHNLQHQHQWTHLEIHTHSPLTQQPLPRPLISGLPPQRLYIHPDEQIELLKAADRARKAKAKAAETATDKTLDLKPASEREWVLPSRLSEKWTLRRLAEVFDAVTLVPPMSKSESGKLEDDNNNNVTTTTTAAENPWRTTKRVVLATADTDSTVVYYIMQDGLVKPRQN